MTSPADPQSVFRTSGGRNSLSTSGHLAGQSSKGSELTSRAAPPWLSHSSFCMWGSDRHGQPPRGDALELSMGKGRGHRFAQGACSSQAHEHWAEAERALLACVPLQGTCPSPRVPFPNRLVDTSTTRSTVGRGRSHPRPTAGEALTSTGAQAGGASRSFYGTSETPASRGAKNRSGPGAYGEAGRDGPVACRAMDFAISHSRGPGRRLRFLPWQKTSVWVS